MLKRRIKRITKVVNFIEYMTNEQLLQFEESLQCKGCKYCLSGKYIHPLGYDFTIKKIAGKEEAWIIGLGILIPTAIFVVLLFIFG